MYTFAICEDERSVLSYLSEQIVSAFGALGESVRLDRFLDGEKLIEAVNGGEDYDALFLDIVMPKIDGFEVCRRLRTWERDMLVVFVSANEELVFQSFEVQPFTFLRKNCIRADIERAARDIVHQLRQKRQWQVVVTEESSGKVHILPVLSTVYAEAQLRMCRVRFEDGEFSIRCKFSELEELLSPCGFIKVHRSYLVNYRHISRIGEREILLRGGGRIPLSRDRTAAVKKEFLLWNRGA